MSIELEIAQLAASAVFRNGLVTIVDAGIDQFYLSDPKTEIVEVTAVAKVAFSEPDTGKQYTGSFKVFDPDLQLVTDVPLQTPTERPPHADLTLPFAFTAISVLKFVPKTFGTFQIRFSVDGAITKDLALSVRPKT
jgi:hypothetical protein